MSTLRFAALALVIPILVGAQDRTADNLFTWSGKLAPGATLGIKHYNGPIDIRASSNDNVEFRAERSRRRSEELTFEVENASDGVTICGVYRGRSACDSGRRGWNSDWDDGPPSARLTVLLPKGVRLRASTGNGDVTIEKASNDLDIASGNGDVRITMSAGRVSVSTGNGDLDIDGATGPVKANTGNGRVYVKTSSGPVTAHTGNGEIDVRMRTLSSDSDMEFVSGNGTVSVALPASFNGEIDANTGNGELQSDFPIKVIGRLNPHHVRGTIGQGGSQTIRMTTGSGRLELRKAN